MANDNGQSRLVQSEPIPETFSFGPFRIVPHARRLERDGSPIPLGSRAFDLLCLLVTRPGDVVSKGELMAKAWPDLTVDESSLRFHIAQLRRALGDGQGGEHYVANVPGRGYCFVATVDRAGSPPKQADQGDRTSTRNLPPRPARIIGRDADISGVAEHLCARRFVTLRGPAGIGKTTLAVAVAHEIGNQFKDGVAFLDLASLKDPHEVATAAASVFGLADPVEDLNSRLLERIRERQVLLVLDNCEHVVEAIAWLAEEIYRYARSVAIVATSRESLQAQGEFVFEMAPLEVPPKGIKGAAELVTYSSAQLLMECALAAGCGANLTDADAEIVGSICRKLDGLPLAIELVASRVSAHGLTHVEELIDGPLRLAWRGRRTAPLRQQSLSAALDWSYELISPAEQTLLQCLSVFPGAFTREGARAVADDHIESSAVVEVLEHLVAKSLVVSCPSPGQARFRLLDTTRAYAAEKLAAAGGTHATNLRHTRYVLQALTPRYFESGGKRPGGWAESSELLVDVRAALEWTYSDVGVPDLQIPLAAVCGRLFAELNLLDEWRLWAGRALCTSDDVDQAA